MICPDCWQLPEDVHGLCSKDAVYFSMHKFIGGAQSPGLLVAKKELFANPAPHTQGGGTVFFVTDTDHRYVQEVRHRYPTCL
jgi:selenocysteine lyase/cysteine desulfurase